MVDFADDPEAVARKVVSLTAGQIITEDRAALMLADQFNGQLAYCHTEGCWREFDGSIWRRCETPVAFAYARQLCRQISGDAKNGVHLAELKYMNAVTTLTARDERVAQSASKWNQNPWLLGTPTVTVDLTTGRSQSASAHDYITRATACPPGQRADCPQWASFLDEATGGDEELQRFLQQIAGYALTGSTKEQSLFFIYGAGGNGKGVFVNTIASVMGDYASTAAMNTFTATKGERHSTDLAMLAGARLVTASETNEGQTWDAQKIGAMTGEDPITARFMRQDYFTYRPEFTLVIIGNYKPALASVNDAMKRRFNIIPFDNKPAKPDHDLYAKLRPEWPGILRWMIDGCLDWQKHGLSRATSVVDKTNQYFYDEDTIQHFLEDECEVDRVNDFCRERSSDLFEAWAAFCKRSGEAAGHAKSFKNAMEKAGFKYRRMNEGVTAFGVKLKAKPQPYWVDR